MDNSIKTVILFLQKKIKNGVREMTKTGKMAEAYENIEIWDDDKQEFINHEIENTDNLYLISFDTEKVIDCASCGNEMIYHEGRPSLRVISDTGSGYMVCRKCFRGELEDGLHQNEKRREQRRIKVQEYHDRRKG